MHDGKERLPVTFTSLLELHDRSPSVVDLFAGAGGLALGFRAPGCEITAAVDVDQEAGRTLEDNFHALQGERPPLVLAGEDADLEQLDLGEVVTDRRPDILIGGPHCLAFGLRRPAGLLDTNTRRIVSRVKQNEKAHSWTVRQDLYELAGPAGPDAAFNYALLDLGALVCRASAPLCDACPVRDLCGFRTASRAKSV